MEEYSNAGGGTVPMIGGQQALPPIIMPPKKGGVKKKTGPMPAMAASFNATKKQFPTLNKLT
jgi:hypothetical protein